MQNFRETSFTSQHRDQGLGDASAPKPTSLIPNRITDQDNSQKATFWEDTLTINGTVNFYLFLPQSILLENASNTFQYGSQSWWLRKKGRQEFRSSGHLQNTLGLRTLIGALWKREVSSFSWLFLLLFCPVEFSFLLCRVLPWKQNLSPFQAALVAQAEVSVNKNSFISLRLFQHFFFFGTLEEHTHTHTRTPVH